jgi:uncharacterized protein (DUF488 family)
MPAPDRSKTWPASTIFTIGHSTRPIPEFLELLRPVAIDLVVDVRSIPRSRTNPQYNADALPQALAAEGIAYHHSRALGGRRPRRKDHSPSPNTMWRNDAFRNFADYAETEAFHDGLDELTGLAREHRCAIMCAEAVWWRCHRRIIADYLVASGRPVAHIMGPDKIEPATLTQGAQMLPNGDLVYPGSAGE